MSLAFTQGIALFIVFFLSLRPTSPAGAKKPNSARSHPVASARQARNSTSAAARRSAATQSAPSLESAPLALRRRARSNSAPARLGTAPDRMRKSSSDSGSTTSSEARRVRWQEPLEVVYSEPALMRAADFAQKGPMASDGQVPAKILKSSSHLVQVSHARDVKRHSWARWSLNALLQRSSVKSV